MSEESELTLLAKALGCDIELLLKFNFEMKDQIFAWLHECEAVKLPTRVSIAMVGSTLQIALETFEKASGVTRPE